MLSTKLVLFILCELMFKHVESYNVALVQYYCDTNAVNSLTPAEFVNRNAEAFNGIVEEVKKENENIDLVLFPESAIDSGINDYKDASTSVPTPEENVIPCDDKNHDYSDFFKSLSCTAKKNRVYLIVNLKEKEDCGNSSKIYNTNVVFDRDGKVVARYRKYNLYLENGVSSAEKPELVTFRSDFGETFGIFTCFDILFEEPAIEMVRKGVKNFLFLTFWAPELPFLTTIQTQQMWAYGNDVNLLTSGISYPPSGSSGLGIYLGARKTLAQDVLPRTFNYYLHKEVPRTVESNSTSCIQEINDSNAREWDKYRIIQEDLNDYSFKKLDLRNSGPINETLCQTDGKRKICCEFQAEISIDSREINDGKDVYNYFLVARTGNRSYGGGAYQNYIEICGLLACSGPTSDKCGVRFENYDNISWPVTFESIQISAEFEKSEKSMQFPNSLLADFLPIDQSCSTWESEEKDNTVRRIFTSHKPVKKLLTFAIFGRIYD